MFVLVMPVSDGLGENNLYIYPPALTMPLSISAFRCVLSQICDMKSDTPLLSKLEQNRRFLLGYHLAFETKRRMNWRQIVLLWFSAASAGHVRAQFYLATCYDDGRGVEKDTAIAYKWYLKAAMKGHMESQYNIGFFYREGEVVKQNDKKAVYWYKLAAAQGDTEAERDLGYCYFYGFGIKKDEKKAVFWYKKAAAKDDPKALYNLGLCYKHGDGVNRSQRWAKYYFERAARLGNSAASVQLREIMTTS
jgi:TPR repeat protein